ncbi:MAG: hypothetical protein ABI543_05395 [Ignavibacteria bacterium]
MITVKLLLFISVLLLAPLTARSQSNISLDAGTIMEIQTGADACADTRTINGTLFGNGTWCLIPLTPAAPLPLSPLNLSVGQNPALNLVWQKTAGALFYHVQLSTDSLFGSFIVNDSTLTDSIRAVSGLAPLTYYWWRVSAKGLGGKSLFSSSFKFRTLGFPVSVLLVTPANNATNQPVSILFTWRIATEQTSPFTSPDNVKLTTPEVNKLSVRSDLAGTIDGVKGLKVKHVTDVTNGTDAIGNYWFDLVTDTVSLANLTRDTTLADTTKSVSSLSNNTSYYWRVRAKNQFGWGGYSVWNKFTTIVSVPLSPVPVTPLNNAVGQNLSLTLVWNKSSFASTYRVQVATDSLFTSIIVNDSTLTDSTRAVSGLTPLTNYWWRINAKNIAGTSSYSAVWKFKTLGSPLQVTLLNPPNNAINQPVSIQFRWSRATEQTSPFTGADNISLNTEGEKNTTRSIDIAEETDAISNYWYELVTDTVSFANLNRDSTLTDTTKTVSGLSNLTSYYWRVKAKNQIAWGGYSAWFKFTTLVSAPIAPLLVSPANNVTGQNLALTLVWNKSINASTYRVQLATDSLFTGIIVNDSTLTDSTRAVSGLTPLTNYWWRINAKNIAGTSSYSAVWKFKTLGSPLQVTLLNPPNNSINQPVSIQFRWSRAPEQTAPYQGPDNINLNKQREKKTPTHIDIAEETDAISNYWYELVTDTVSFANLNRDSTLTDTTKTVSGLSNTTNYWWRVKAKNQISWGNFAGWFKFTTAILPPAVVNLNVIPGGFYNTGTGRLNMRDTIHVYLVDSATCNIVDSTKGVLDSVTFGASISFSNANTGNYYMLVYHRNHLGVATRFKATVTRGATVSYDFTTDSAKAFGFNMIKVSTSPVRWAMIPGDANRDGFVDGLDQTIWLGENGFDGYLASDFNGDGFIDGLDQTLWIIYNGNSSFLPCGFVLDPFTGQIKVNTSDYDAKKSNKLLFESKKHETPIENNTKQNNNRK